MGAKINEVDLPSMATNPETACLLYQQRPQLPSYTPQPSAQPQAAVLPGVEHIRTTNKTGDIILRFRSYASKPDAVPIFTSGQPITGTVELSVKKKMSLKIAAIKLEGYRRSPLSSEDKPFVEISQTLWPNSTSGAEVKKIDAGIHKWSFSLLLPDRTTGLSRDGSEHPLPPTFSDGRSAEYIMYEMTFLLEKGMFSANSGYVFVRICLLQTHTEGAATLDRIIFPILYSPRTIASPSHPALQAAYRESTPLPDPLSCPAAWSTTLITLTGRVFAQREVTVALKVNGSYFS
jgi:hypothetical protein